MSTGPAATVVEHVRRLTALELAAQQSDAELLERFATQRDDLAFEALVARHGPMVLRVCTRILHNRTDAEDAYQATFLVLVRRVAFLRKYQSVGCFLHGVALRVSRRLRTGAPKEDCAAAQETVTLSTGPPADASWREMQSVLDHELGQLGEKYRAPLVLCYLEERTQDEAA